MAVRAEYLGIGIYGNKNVAPDIEVVEFGTAVARPLRPGTESEEFRTSSGEVKGTLMIIGVGRHHLMTNQRMRTFGGRIAS